MVCLRSLYPPSKENLDQMKDGIESLSYTGNHRDFIQNLAFSKYLKQYRGCYAMFCCLKWFLVHSDKSDFFILT